MENNIHLTGSMLRASDGLAPTTIQTCNFSSNAVTSVVRFEGRAWVFNASEWLQRTDNVIKIGGFSQKQTQAMHQQLEDRRFKDMVGHVAVFGSRLLAKHIAPYGTGAVHSIPAMSVIASVQKGEPFLAAHAVNL